MSSAASPSDASSESPPAQRRRIGVDWWAVILAGAFVILAATGLLPTIGW